MAFIALYTDGELSNVPVRKRCSTSVQFVDSVYQICPQVNLLFLKNAGPQVVRALQVDFHVCETPFGCVATKWNVTHWNTTDTMCRFNVHSSVTVTFGYYESLYALENDLPLLQEVPVFREHFFCVVVRRCLNWKSMVNICTKILQLEFPPYQASRSYQGTDIVLMGWQRGVTVMWRNPLVISDPLKYVSHRLFKCWRLYKKYNDSPVLQFWSAYPYPLYFPWARKKKYRQVRRQEESKLESIPIPAIVTEVASTATTTGPSSPTAKNPNTCSTPPTSTIPTSSDTVDDLADIYFSTAHESLISHSTPHVRHTSEDIEEWVLTAVCIEE